jgi:hypothetical protein
MGNGLKVASLFYSNGYFLKVTCPPLYRCIEQTVTRWWMNLWLVLSLLRHGICSWVFNLNFKFYGGSEVPYRYDTNGKVSSCGTGTMLKGLSILKYLLGKAMVDLLLYMCREVFATLIATGCHRVVAIRWEIPMRAFQLAKIVILVFLRRL